MTTDGKEQHGAQAHAELWELKDIRFAMFTVRDASGHLSSRPYDDAEHGIRRGFQFVVLHVTHKRSQRRQTWRATRAVNVVYADPARDSYGSVSGNATARDDAAKKHKLWTKLTQAWFPGGPTDPDLALVQVKISHAEYWDVDSNQAVQLFKMAKAVVTGKPPDMGSHGEVHMA